jgi:hypothetical protein
MRPLANEGESSSFINRRNMGDNISSERVN